MVEPVHADPRLRSVDMAILDLDLFPPLEEWTEYDWDEAILLTSTYRSALAMQNGAVPSGPWPEVRADLSAFPPLEEWTEDDWDEAILLTKAVQAESNPTQHPPMPLEVLIDRLGFEVVDGEVRRRE